MQQMFAFALIFWAFMLLAELIAGRHRGAYAGDEWKVTIASLVLSMGVTRPLAGILLALLFRAVLPQWHDAWAGMPLLPAFLLIAISSEFAFYWVHRLAHEGAGKYPRLGWLWKLHRTHHSSKHLTVMTNFRHNLAWTFIQPQAWVYGLAIHLGLGAAAGLTAGVLLAWNVLTHGNFRWDDPIRRHPRIGRFFRLAEHLFVSPGLHHTHHGYGRDGASYRNYAVMFSFFDTLFGTLHIPNGRPAKYGLPGPNAPWTEEIFYPLVRARR